MHVFAKLRGRGYELLPHYPYRFERSSDTELTAVRRRDNKRLVAKLDFSTTPPSATITPAKAKLEDIVALTKLDEAAGDSRQDWRVITSLYTCAWPAALQIVAVEPGAPSAFDFIVRDDGLLYFQGPFPKARFDDLTKLAAKGQTVSATGAGFIELAYTQDGQPWIQRHDVVALSPTHALALSTQALAEHRDATFAAAAELIAGVEPYVSDR
jgi:hypothetical protein